MILQTPRGRFGTVAASFIVFFIVFAFSYPRFGLPITSLGIIPVLIGAWIYGIWSGILFTFTIYAVDVLIVLFLSGGKVEMALLPGNIFGLAVGMAASVIMGRQGKLSRRNQAEVRQSTSLMEEHANHAHFLTLLNDIVSTAMEPDDMATMLNVLANRTGKLFNADHCFISFWDEKLRKTIPMAAYGPRSTAFFPTLRQFGGNERTLTAAVLDAGHAFAIEDIANSSSISQKVAEQFAAGSVLGLPLISGNRKLGAVVLGFDNHHSFSEEEINHAELAARQISLAVTKTMLLEEAHQRVTELAGLHDVSRAFSLHGNASQTFRLLSETLAGLIGVRICLICTYEPGDDELRARVPAYGLDDITASIFHWSLTQLEDVWDLSRDHMIRANSQAEIPAKLLPMVRSMGVNSVLAIALWDDIHLLGAIFTANKPGGFSKEDAHLLEVLASQVAVVIQNVRLFHTERTLAEQMGVLYSIAIAATQADNEDQLIEHVSDIIGQRLYSDSFGILLLDEATHELFLHSSYRIGAHEGLVRVPMGVGVTGAVARTGKPLRVDDVSVSPDYLSLYPLTRSELCVPLKVESKMLGVVNAESTRASAFTVEDEELLTIIAGQLATAIQRLRTVQAERYQTHQLERSNALIRALAHVNARAAVAVDPDGVLQTLGVELAKLGLRCAIALADNAEQHAVVRYISLSDRVIQALERIANIRMRNYILPVEKLSPPCNCAEDACLVTDALALLMSWAPGFPSRKAKKILGLMGLTDTSSVCYLPLITEGKPIGVLWMWGEGIHESDLPTMSLFASQLAAALQNASLLTKVGRLAITDDLTGIFNRRHFFTLAEEQFARAQKNGSHLSALIVDLDHFKKFNDTYGHVVGDQVLRAAAQMMSASLRDRDIIGRYGGEEFSIILPDTNNTAAIFAAERLLSQVADVPIETDAGLLTIQLSIGVAGMSNATPTLHSLIVRADEALYIAKGAGRNRLSVK